MPDRRHRADARRNLDSASRRLPPATWTPASRDASRVPVMRRARALVAENAHARSAVDAWTAGLVGTGIKPQSQHPDRAMRETLSVGFEAWTDDADHEDRTDFYGLQALVATLLVRDGEAFVRFLADDDGALRLQVLDADQISGDTAELEGGRQIVQGVEFDAAGRRVAYHLFQDNPSLPLVASVDTVRIPADEICHVFRRDAPGQVRGVSWFAPVLLRLADYDAAVDAQLVRQKIAALLTGFVTTPDGTAGPFSEGDGLDGILEAGLEPGEMRVLHAGQDVRFSDPARVGAEVIDFLRATRREIAAGLGLPAHLLDGDLSDANYSSLRAGLIEFRRRLETLQWGVIVHQFLRPTWRRWVAAEALAGRLPVRAFTDPGFRAVRWITPRQEWVDPMKDAEAEVLAIRSGLMSRREAVGSRGQDIEQLDQEIAADRDRAAALGLDFDPVTGGRDNG